MAVLFIISCIFLLNRYWQSSNIYYIIYIVYFIRVIWKEKCGVWQLIPTSRSVLPSAMTKPCAYGTSRPATACWPYANSEKVSRLFQREEVHRSQAFNQWAVLLRRPLLLLLP